MKWILPTIVVGGAIAYYLKDKAQQMAEQVKFNVLAVGIDKKKTNLTRTTIFATFRITNPTDDPVNLKSIIGDIKILGQSLTFSMLEGATVEPRSTKDIKVFVEIPSITGGTLVGNIIKSIKTGTPVTAELIGAVNLKQGRIDFTEQMKLI